MKNIHILPTDKPSRLYNCFSNLEIGEFVSTRDGLLVTNQHIYITSDEEIREGDFFLHPFNTIHKAGGNLTDKDFKKIILTTDQDLNKDGVWGIEDGFLEWFVKNPDCEFVELRGYAIILPGEWEEDTPEPKKETLEEVANILVFNGTKWQQEQDKNKFSEEIEMLWLKYRSYTNNEDAWSFKEWLVEQFKNK